MSERSEKRLAIFGLGGVGTALLELLAERHPALRLTGIADSRGYSRATSIHATR